MLDEVREDVAIEAVSSRGVERSAAESACSVDSRETGQIQIRCNDHIKRCEILWRSQLYICCVDVERNPWIELSNLGR